MAIIFDVVVLKQIGWFWVVTVEHQIGGISLKIRFSRS